MINRIRQQERILEVVNRHVPVERQLAGLTVASINDWVGRNRGTGLEVIQDMLIEASKIIGVLHDRSNPPGDGNESADVGWIAQEIEKKLTEC